MASLEALAGFDHLQEVILQNFVPHRRYYGEEPAEIATEAAEGYWRTGLARRAGSTTRPTWANPVTIDDMKRLIAETRRLMPDVGIQVPPNLADWWPELVARGRDRPRRPVGQRRPHLARAPVPVAAPRCASGSPPTASRSPSACASTRSTSTRSGMAPRVLEVIRAPATASFMPRRRGGALRPGTIERARDGPALAGGARGAVRREPARGDRGHAPGRRRAARRAGRRPRDVRRQPQHQRLQRLHRRLRVLRLRRLASARRTPTSTTATTSCAACTTRSPSARPRSACSRASTPTGGSRTTSAGCGWPRRPRREIHLHAYSPMEIAHMCDVSGLPPRRGVRAAARGRPGLRPGHRRRGARTTACASASARTSCRSRAGWRSSRPPHRAGLRSTVTVMFGHIETPAELAEHMRVVRALQERTGGFTEFVPLSFIPFQTLLGRTHGHRARSRARRTSSTRPCSGSRSGARSRRCRRAG